MRLIPVHRAIGGDRWEAAQVKLLVTKAAGFTGSHHLRTTPAGGHPGPEEGRVTVLDKPAHASNRADPPAGRPRLQSVQQDVCDLPLLLDLLPGHDAVVHFAAESHGDRSLGDASGFIRSHAAGTHTVPAACHQAGAEQTAQVPADEVDGCAEHGRSAQSAPLPPNSPCAASKAALDLTVRSFARTPGPDVPPTRCSTNHGPRQDAEKPIPLFLTHLREGVPVPLYGDVRERLHADDHGRAIQPVPTRGSAGKTCNAGGGNAFTDDEITRMLPGLSGAGEPTVRRVTDRPGHDLRYAIDETKIRAEPGHRPPVPFDQQLAGTHARYRDHPHRGKPLKQDVLR